MDRDYTDAIGTQFAAFQAWRAERPFFGAVLLVLAGVIIGYVPMQLLADISVLQGSFVFIGLTFGILVSLSGIFVLLRPEHSTFFGIAGVVLSTLSIVGAMGGLFLGMFLGTVGGVLCFAWRADEDREGKTVAQRLRGLWRANTASVLLLGLTVVLLLYFVHPLAPPLGALIPDAAGQTTYPQCNANTSSVFPMICQNPTVDEGLGGAMIFMGAFSTPGVTHTQITLESSARQDILGVSLSIQNPDYSQGPYADSSPYKGFIFRKNLISENGRDYALFINSSSGSIDGGSNDAIALEITEIYNDVLYGTSLGFTLDYSDELSCEPRNYGALDDAESFDASIDANGLTVNAHYAQASQWTLNDFTLSVVGGARRMLSPNPPSSLVHNCPGAH
ncbi:MAG: DUF6114 domain-containing protein [Halorientalis sp.]